MTHKHFWQDPYCTQLETTITHIDGPRVMVAATILYAFAGGQESDTGTIGGYPVLAAVKDGTAITYTLPDNHALQVGQAVVQVLDWPRRYQLMRLHFAVELVLELTYRHRPGILKIGAHIAEDKSRVDFESAENLNALLPTVRAEAQALIDAQHPIISAFSDPATERRYWEIEGFARVACGGTHLRNTGEIGTISLKRKNVGKHKERIEVTVVAGGGL